MKYAILTALVLVLNTVSTGAWACIQLQGSYAAPDTLDGRGHPQPGTYLEISNTCDEVKLLFNNQPRETYQKGTLKRQRTENGRSFNEETTTDITDSNIRVVTKKVYSDGSKESYTTEISRLGTDLVLESSYTMGTYVSDEETEILKPTQRRRY